jgi:hypothetical protein
LGAKLRFAKVIDRQMFYEKGAKVHPGLDNEVLMHEEPGPAGAFLVLRGWGDDHGSFTEKWRIQEPEGRTIYESSPREIHVPTNGHVEKLEDEVADLEFEFASDGYSVVFTLDERDVARATFTVKIDGR